MRPRRKETSQVAGVYQDASLLDGAGTGRTVFEGTSRMGLEIQQFSVVAVEKPRVSLSTSSSLLPHLQCILRRDLYIQNQSTASVSLRANARVYECTYARVGMLRMCVGRGFLVYRPSRFSVYERPVLCLSTGRPVVTFLALRFSLLRLQRKLEETRNQMQANGGTPGPLSSVRWGRRQALGVYIHLTANHVSDVRLSLLSCECSLTGGQNGESEILRLLARAVSSFLVLRARGFITASDGSARLSFFQSFLSLGESSSSFQ